MVSAKWADGDSFPIRQPDGTEMTLRLYGADCFEWHVTDTADEDRLSKQRRYFGIANVKPTAAESIRIAKDFGARAAAEVRRLLVKPFTVHTNFADARGDGRYKRFYAFVICADGTDLAAHLVSKGLARAFGVARQTWDGRSQAEYREFLSDLELQAAKRAAGVWALTDWEKLPHERQQQRKEDEEVEIALDKEPLADGRKLDPNTAARDELMKLPGIGEAMAHRIIEHRPFAKLEDLLQVPGIGPATYRKLLPHLTTAGRGK